MVFAVLAFSIAVALIIEWAFPLDLEERGWRWVSIAGTSLSVFVLGLLVSSLVETYLLPVLS